MIKDIISKKDKFLKDHHHKKINKEKNKKILYLHSKLINSKEMLKPILKKEIKLNINSKVYKVNMRVLRRNIQSLKNNYHLLKSYYLLIFKNYNNFNK